MNKPTDIFLDEELCVHVCSTANRDRQAVSLGDLFQALGERLNPGGYGNAGNRKVVDDLRIRLIEITTDFGMYGTIDYGPSDELGKRELAAVQFGSPQSTNARDNRARGEDYEFREE